MYIPNRDITDAMLLNNAKLYQFILPPVSRRVPVPKPCYHNLTLPDFFLVYGSSVMEKPHLNPTLISPSYMPSFQRVKNVFPFKVCPFCCIAHNCLTWLYRNIWLSVWIPDIECDRISKNLGPSIAAL